MISSSFGGRSGLSWLALGGLSLRIAVKMTPVVVPLKAGRPVAISYKTAPKLKRSVLASSCSPRACSGDM